jgi:hypothetical protein
MLMMMSPIQGAINYGREDKQIASALGLFDSLVWMSQDAFHEKTRGETPVFGGSSNGGFWSRKVENALSGD